MQIILVQGFCPVVTPTSGGFRLKFSSRISIFIRGLALIGVLNNRALFKIHFIAVHSIRSQEFLASKWLSERRYSWFSCDVGPGRTRRQKICKLGRISGKSLVEQIFVPKFLLNAVALGSDNLIFYT